MAFKSVYLYLVGGSVGITSYCPASSDTRCSFHHSEVNDDSTWRLKAVDQYKTWPGTTSNPKGWTVTATRSHVPLTQHHNEDFTDINLIASIGLSLPSSWTIFDPPSATPPGFNPIRSPITPISHGQSGQWTCWSISLSFPLLLDDRVLKHSLCYCLESEKYVFPKMPELNLPFCENAAEETRHSRPIADNHFWPVFPP